MPEGFKKWLHPGSNEIHPWRWRALTAWIIIFTCMVIFVLYKARSTATQANDISKDNKALIERTRITGRELLKAKASVKSLKRTNCGLEIFLLTARKARYDSATHESGKDQHSDLQAAKGYKALADKFQNESCVIPKKLILPIDRKKAHAQPK